MFDADRGYDDGITTGWICCNLGSVDAAVMPDDEIQAGQSQTPSAEEGDSTAVDDVASLHEIFSPKDQERPLDDEAEYSNPGDDDFTYRGFGDVSMAPRIVVQIFTEQKRAEMDLEGLWEARIKRRDEKEEKSDRLFEMSILEKEIETPGVRRVDGQQTEEPFESDSQGTGFQPMYRKSS